MLRSAFLALALAPLAATAQEATVPITALPFLGVPAVAEMGGATVGRVSLDPRAALQNPAALGLAARDAVQTVGGTPTEDWFGESRYGVGATAWNVRRGRLAGSVAIAQGAMHGTARTLADGTLYAPTDRFRSLSLGVGTTGVVRVAMGATGRYVTSTDVPVWDGTAFHVGRLRGVTFDGGVLAQADVAALAGRPTVAGLAPALDVATGYAQTNVGGGVRYSGFGPQALPRLGALGWSARAGLDAPVGTAVVRLVEAEVAFSAERLLVEQAAETTGYAPVTGRMPLAAPLTGTGDERTTGRRGARVALAETVALSWGRFDGWGYDDARTRSWEVGTAGTARWLATQTDGVVADVLRRVDLRIGQTTVWAGTPEAEVRTTVTLAIRR